MSGTAKWREEQVLVVCPGSKTTMAQLGCNELTPPIHRIPTRMFKDPEDGAWRPYHTFKRRKPAAAAQKEEKKDGAAQGDESKDDDWEWVEDKDSDEGAIYPMQCE